MLVPSKEEQRIVTIPRHFPAGEVVAFDVSADIYLRDYAEYFYEWVEGVLVKMSPVTDKHDELSSYLRKLLEAYFAFKPIGQIRSAPFVMRLEKSRREPDLQVILNSNQGRLNSTYMDGAADICIEIVSASNSSVDYGEKFIEYEAGGVQEYWLIDPIRKAAHFYRLNEQKSYSQFSIEINKYTTPLLPRLQIPINILWADNLPNILEVVEMVKKMLEDSE